MFTTFRAAAAALVFTAIAGTAQAQTQAASPTPNKIGYVKTEALMAAAPGRDAAQATYDKEVAAFTLQQKKWSDSLQKLVDDYKKAAPKMTDAQKQAQELKISGIQSDLDAKNQDGQQKMQARQNELLAPLMEVVKKAIEDIRVEDGYAIIFSGDANSPIVSADKNLDLTDRVVGRLKTIAAKAPAPPSQMGPAAVVKKPPTR
jgi:outer membrane protein